MKKETIVSRVQKLLALGRSPNEHEAGAARDAAESLIKEHGLSEEDLSAEVEKEVTELAMGSDGFSAPWRFVLVSMVARAFSCEAISLRIGQRRKIRVVGKKIDVQTAATAFKVLVREVEKLVDGEMEDVVIKAFLVPWTERSYKTAFRNGVVSALADSLREEARRQPARPSDRAIAVSKLGVRDHMQARYGRSKIEDTRLDDHGSLLEGEAYWRGFVKGSEVSIPGKDTAERWRIGNSSTGPSVST